MRFSKPTIILQARMGSSRLPNKVLKNIIGKPMIWYVIHRLKKVKYAKQIILATTNLRKDHILVDIAGKNNLLSFRGSSTDVLDRYYKCAKQFAADPIIRITGDCPLIDPKIIDNMIQFFKRNSYDYISNTIIPTYPDGLDVEVFSFNTLKLTALNAKLKSEREHVTPYILNSGLFTTYNYENDIDLSQYRWTVDEVVDLEFIHAIYKEFSPQIDFTTKNVISLLQRKPELLSINSGIMRNEGYKHSLLNDFNVQSKKPLDQTHRK